MKTEHLRFQKLPGASSARATGGKPATGRCWTSVICDVHGGGRSGGRVELRPRFTVCNQSWDISLVLLPSAWPYAALFSSNPASPCVQSLTSIACSDMPDTFFLSRQLCARAPPLLACPPLCCTSFVLVICHVCPKIPQCDYSSVSCPQWFFGDAAFLLVDGFLPPRTTLLLRIDSALAV